MKFMSNTSQRWLRGLRRQYVCLRSPVQIPMPVFSEMERSMPGFEYVGSNLVEAFLIVLVHAHCEVSHEKACTMNLEYSREEISGICASW